MAIVNNGIPTQQQVHSGTPGIRLNSSAPEKKAVENPHERVELGKISQEELRQFEQEHDLKKLADDNRLPHVFRHTGKSMEDVMESTHIGIEVAETLLEGCAHEVTGAASLAEKGVSTAESVMETVGPIGAATVGIYFGIKGARDMRHAIKDRDIKEVIEATGELALSGHSGLEVAHAASKAIGGGFAAAMHNPAIAGLSASLGILHGAVDVVIGGKQAYEGIREKDVKKATIGLMDVGIGTSVIALTLGGGIPAAIAVGALFLIQQSVEHSDVLKRGIEKLVNKITGHTSEKQETQAPASPVQSEPVQDSHKDSNISDDTGKIRFDNIKSAYGWDLSPEQQRMKDIMEEHFIN